MEKLSASIFNNAELPKSTLHRIVGGTGGGTKVVNEGTNTSATVSWTSDTANGTLSGYSRVNDNCETAQG